MIIVIYNDSSFGELSGGGTQGGFYNIFSSQPRKLHATYVAIKKT